MPRRPEQPPRTEAPLHPFLLASRFDSRATSQAPYDTIQAIVRKQEVAEFSVFRMIQNWPESMSKAPPSPKRWYVAVIGHPPPEPLLKQVTEAINTGEPLPLPDEVISVLAAKRVKETTERPYTEIHRTFTVRSKKDKEKSSSRRSHAAVIEGNSLSIVVYLFFVPIRRDYRYYLQYPFDLLHNICYGICF